MTYPTFILRTPTGKIEHSLDEAIKSKLSHKYSDSDGCIEDLARSVESTSELLGALITKMYRAHILSNQDIEEFLGHGWELKKE